MPVMEMIQVLRAAEGGGQAEMQRLREVLDSTDLADSLGDLSRYAESKILEQLSSKEAWREMFRKKLDKMRAELAGPNPSPLEHLLESVC